MSEFSSQAIKENLQTITIGSEIHYFDEVESTNDIAKSLAEKGAKDGEVVIAERQRKGKGRLGRVWHSPPGGIWLSIILKPEITPSDAPKITLLAGVAVARTINEMCYLNVKLKWPNDILFNEKKAGGILTEMHAEVGKVNYVIVGIGINANLDIVSFQGELQTTATTLKHELKKDIDRNKFVQRLLMEFENEYSSFLNDNFASTVKKWKTLSGTLGRKVRITTAAEIIQGIALDIDKDGALLVKNNGIKRVLAGECVHLSET